MMFRALLITALVLEVGLFSVAAVDVFLANTYMTGSSAYFTIKRAALQQRLQEIQLSNGIQYHLPANPPTFTDFGSDEHVIQIVVVREEAESIPETVAPSYQFSTKSKIFAVVVPFLSTTEGGPAEVSLLLRSYRSRTDRGRLVIDPNVVIPTEVERVDVLLISDTELIFRSGELSLELRERRNARFCNTQPPSKIVDLGLFGRDLLTSLHGPDFSVCDYNQGLTIALCENYRKSKDVVRAAGIDVCEYLRPEAKVLETCPTVFEITSVSPKMREFLLLSDDVGESVTATVQRGVFGVYLKAPCIAEPTAKRYDTVRRFFTL